MKILYIYRNKSLGFSITNVFNPIEEEMKKYAEVDSFYLPVAGAMPWHIWHNVRAACKKAESQQYDIIHITGSEYYLAYFLSRKHKVVVTVHDLGFFTDAKVTLRTLILYLGWIYVLKYADKITCISEKTQNEVKTKIKIPSSRICTINNPLPNYFKFKTKNLNIHCPIILHIGTKPNKNLYNTILALRDFPCQLRIIGKIDDKLRTLLNDNRIGYSNAFNLTNEEIVREYENCDIVNFPSLYEGFGMPIIEGQAIGRVVITSDLAPMNEIASDSAILVNPTDIRSILDGYKCAMANYDNYVEAGRENIKRFSLEIITKEYYKVYREFEYNNHLKSHIV